MDFFKTIENGIRTIFGGNSNQNGQNSNDWEEAERRRKQAEEEQRKKEEEQRRREEEERRRQEAERKRQEEERQRQEAEKQRQIEAAKPREQREAEFVEARVKKEREEWDKSRDVFSKALGLNAFNENQARAAAKASFATNNTNWDDENQVKETQKLTRANKDIADSIASDKNQRANTEGLGRAYQDITRAEDSNQINKQKMREYLSNAYQAGEMTAEQVKAGIEKYGLDNFIDGSNHKHFDESTGKFRQATMSELAEDFTGKVQGAAEPINQLGEAVADASDTLLRKWWDKGDSTPDSFNFADPADYLRALTGLPGGMVRGVTGFGKKMTGGIGKTLAGGLDNDANKIIAGTAQIGDATIDIAGLNYGGTGTLIKSLGKETAEKIIKSGGKETVKEILKNAAQEGGEEAVQNVLEQISNNGGHLDKIDLNQVKESGIAGAVGGGLASGIGQANAKIKNSNPNFKNLGENIKDLYHDGKLAPQTALTPNAGSRARLEKAFEDGLMGEQISGNKNIGRISNQDLMRANQIQEALNRDNLNPNRNISINGETAAEHAQKRFAENPENTPRKLAETAHNAIFGNNHQILANNQDNANNVLFINKNTPRGVVPVGKSSISSENEIFSVIPTREQVLDKIEKDSTNLVKNSTPAEAGATYSLSQNNKNVNKKGIIKNLKTDNIQSVGEIMESQPFKNVPLEGDNLLTKGNLYNMTKIGSSKDLTTKPIKDGSYEYREHKVVKNGKSYQQFERRYIGNGEIGDWQPYNKALYLWRSQSEKIDKANRDELIQEALSEARKTGDVKDFVGYTDPTTGAQVVKALTGEKTIDGGLVRDPKTGEVEGNHIAVTPFGVVNYVNGKYDVIDADALATTKKSKVGVSDTFERAVDKTYGENSDTANNLKDIVSEKRQNYSGFVEEFQKLNHEHQQLAKEVGKAKPFGKSEKEFWQDTGRLIEQTLVGEHKSSDENFKAKYGEKAYLEAKKYADWSRENYDKMIDGVNAVRRLLGKEEIEYRKNYLPHISKDGNWLDGAKNSIATATGFRGEMEGQSRGEIPANIAGLSETFKPTQKWNGNEKQRTGAMQDYELDPRKVMEKYAEVMLYNKHMEQTMARARSVEQAIRAQTEAKGQIFTDPDSVMKQGGEINNQILHKISDWTNALAGKSSAFDRSFLDRTNKQMQVVQKLERINGANKIAGNISSTFAQALNLPETIAQNGINKTAQSLLFAGTKEAKAAREKSAFLRERYMDTDTKFSKSGGQKVSELVSKASGMDLVEKAFINLNWGANYWRLKSEGYQGHELIKMTDRATAKAVGGRGIGDMPEIYRSAVGKMFLQFTYETNETWKNNGERLKGVVKNLKTGDFKNAGKTSLKMAEAYVATMALNALYKQMTGNEPLPEPITPLVSEIAKNFDNDDENNTDLAKLGAKAVEQVGKANPFAQAALNLIPKTERQKIFGKDSDLGRYDGASGVAQTATNLIGAGVNALQGNGEGIVKNLLGVVPGGSQIKKTVGGAEAMLNGEVKDNKGNTKYSVDNSNPLKWAQAMVFGKNALSESQKYNEASTDEKKAIRTTAEISKKGNLNEEIKQAVERNAKMSKSEEYKKSAQKLEDEMLIKLGKGEVELDENGLYRNKKTGKVQAEFYHNLAKRNREEGKNAKNRYKEFLNSEKGKMVEFEEAKAEYEARLNAGDLSKKEQVEMMDKLRKLAAQKDYRKEYRDGYKMTNSKTEISKLYNLYDENGKADMRNNLNAINDRMLEAGLITQKQYNSRYENINGIEKTKSGGKGRSSSGAKSDTFSVIGSVQPFKVTEAPVVKSAAKTGRGIVKGLKVDSSKAKISTTEMPRMRVTIRR